MVQRASGDLDRPSSSFNSPFRSLENPASKVPSFKAYMSKKGESPNKVFQYFMVGTMGALAAAGAKATVQGRLWPGIRDTARSNRIKTKLILVVKQIS